MLKNEVFCHDEIELIARPYFQRRRDIQIFLQQLERGLPHLRGQGGPISSCSVGLLLFPPLSPPIESIV